MHTFKIDLMTVLVLAVILGIILTMSLGNRNDVETIGAINTTPQFVGVIDTQNSTGDLVEKVTFKARGQHRSETSVSINDGLSNEESAQNDAQHMVADKNDAPLI